jgi:hypothetical protein
VKSTDTSQNIMGSQVGIFDKAGLGFITSQNQKICQNFLYQRKLRRLMKNVHFGKGLDIMNLYAFTKRNMIKNVILKIYFILDQNALKRLRRLE